MKRIHLQVAWVLSRGVTQGAVEALVGRTASAQDANGYPVNTDCCLCHNEAMRG